MNGAVVSALASHWRRNRLQLLTLVLGLAMATALWSGVQAINAEARASYDAAAATLAEGRFDQLLPRDGDTIAQQRFVDLRRAGWLVSPVVEGRLRVGRTAVRLIGVDPLTMPQGSAASAALARTDLDSIVRADTLVAGPEAAALLAGICREPGRDRPSGRAGNGSCRYRRRAVAAEEGGADQPADRAGRPAAAAAPARRDRAGPRAAAARRRRAMSGG